VAEKSGEDDFPNVGKMSMHLRVNRMFQKQACVDLPNLEWPNVITISLTACYKNFSHVLVLYS